eukprot:755599-Pleurochrysis_carterae.AAC.1
MERDEIERMIDELDATVHAAPKISGGDADLDEADERDASKRHAAATAAAAAAVLADVAATVDEATPVADDAITAAARRPSSRGSVSSSTSVPPNTSAGLALRAMSMADELRKRLLSRARNLDVLQSEGVPDGEIALSIEPSTQIDETVSAPEAAPAPRKGAAAAKGGGAKGGGAKEEVKESAKPAALVEAARAVREAHEAELLSYCEEYYASKGDRAITRPLQIPKTMEEQKDKVAAACESLMTKTEEERQASIKALRLQLVRTSRALNSLGRWAPPG